MGIPERREREKEEVRRKILDAARDLFAAEGYDNVTMRRIADTIEYSPTAIYYHFKDKEALVRSLCEEHFSGLLGAMSESQLPADPIELIRQLGRAYARFGIEHPNHYRFMFLTPPPREFEHQPSEAGDRSFALLKGGVDRAIRSGLFREGDARAIAQVLWANVHGVVALLTTFKPEHFPDGPAVSDLVDRVIENGIRGFLPERS